MTTPAATAGSIAGRLTRRLDRMSDGRFAALMFVPGAVLVIVLVILPIVLFVAMSMLRIELVKDDNTPFIGINNFVRAFNDEDFVASIPRTVALGAGMTALVVPMALATALLLNKPFRGASILGVAVLLPYAIANVVTGIFWAFIFNSHFGIATGIAIALGITSTPIPWLTDPTLAMVVAVVASAWRVMPLLALILLASLKTIPSSLYRAAKMDGASTWQAFRNVTLPGISNSLAVVVVLSIIISLQIFDVLFSLTGGGPGRQTTVMSYYIYIRAFQNLSLGYSSALAVILLVIVVVCSSSLILFRNRRPAAAATIDADDLTGSTRFPSRGPALSAVDRSGGGAFSRPPRERSWETEQTNRRRRAMPRTLGRALLGLAVAALLAWILLPIIWIAIASVQPENAITVAPPALEPSINLDWYRYLLGQDRFTGSFFVSATLALSVMIVTIVIASIAAYPLARFRVPHANKVMGVLVFTQMVPEVVLAIPILLIYQRLADVVNLRDTVAGLVLINVAFWVPLIVWLLKNYFEEVPRSIEQAARIDGCSRLGTLFRITIPAARSGIAAVAILLLIGTWNEFLFAAVLSDRNAVTITRRITDVQAINPAFGVIYSEDAAAGILAILAPMVLVLVFNRRLVRGLTEGFVKG